MEALLPVLCIEPRLCGGLCGLLMLGRVFGLVVCSSMVVEVCGMGALTGRKQEVLGSGGAEVQVQAPSPHRSSAQRCGRPGIGSVRFAWIKTEVCHG